MISRTMFIDILILPQVCSVMVKRELGKFVLRFLHNQEYANCEIFS